MKRIRWLTTKTAERLIGAGEHIVDKFWIDPSGQVETITGGWTHQDWAWSRLREEGTRLPLSNSGKLRAENTLLDQDWIRGQVYAQDGLGLHGNESALMTRGPNAIAQWPQTRRVYFQKHPTGQGTMYLSEELKTLGWPEAVKTARKKTN